MLAPRNPSPWRDTGARSSKVFWTLAASKLFRVVLLALSLLFSLVFFFWRRPLGPGAVFSTQLGSNDGGDLTHAGKGRLHLLVPATSSNPDLCKTLLSAQILGYPSAVLINYGDSEDLEDVYKQHISKVKGILEYLERLESSNEYAEELVAIVDGYDVWFQLRPDVLVKRYYALNAEADRRTREVYGNRLFESRDMRQRILFGPDKLCWPIDYSRPACWAVPDAPEVPQYAFGPASSKTFIDMFMPRWLNSGSIIGNARDLRLLFAATLEMIDKHYVSDSDQFYFGNLFGQQEYARLSTHPELLQTMKDTRIGIETTTPGEPLNRSEPALDSTTRTEYNIGIDYTSSAFQTVAFYKQYLTWMRASDSWRQPSPPDQQALGSLAAHGGRYAMELPNDIQASLPPFYALDTGEQSTQWSEVDLLYNPITKQIPVLIHFTGQGEKSLRKLWWQKMSFQSRADSLRLASQKLESGPISPSLINGLTWYNAEPSDAEDVPFGGKGGAWSDTGGWLSWSTLCKPHDSIFEIANEDFYHAPPTKEKTDDKHES